MEIKTWLIWILLIIVIVLGFPKSCGNKLPSDVLKYSCAGFQTPLLSSFDKSNNPTDWCSGICFSETIKKPANNTNATNLSTAQQPGFASPVSGIMDSFVKAAPALAIVFGILILAKWLNSLSKKGKTEIRIVRGPQQ